MRQASQDRLKADIDGFLATSSTTMALAEYANPVSVYADQGHLAAELSTVFRRVPLVVAHGSEVANPGDFLTQELSGVPVLVVRQPDGSVRAFVNLCRHRGAQLALEPSGCDRRFTCVYHAWTYKLDGSLSAIPNDEGFAGVDRDGLGLVRLSAEERHGLVWVILTPGLAIDVASFLGESLDDELAAWRLDTYGVERSRTLTERTNWKLIVDGFLETYHLRYLHANTVGPYIKSNLGPFTPFGPHGRMAIVRSRYDSEASSGDRFLRDVGAVYSIFPNTVLVWQSTHFERWSVLPDAADPGRCRAYTSILSPAGQKGEVELWDKNWKILLSTVQEEDWPVARATQAGFAAGAIPTMIFGRNEPALQHFHRSLAATISG